MPETLISLAVTCHPNAVKQVPLVDDARAVRFLNVMDRPQTGAYQI